MKEETAHEDERPALRSVLCLDTNKLTADGIEVETVSIKNGVVRIAYKTQGMTELFDNDIRTALVAKYGSQFIEGIYEDLHRQFTAKIVLHILSR